MCIQALGRRHHRANLSRADARELALIYGDIGAAILAWERARAVHVGTGSREFVDRLAIAEAAVAGRSTWGHTVEAVIGIRREAHRSRERGSRVVQEARRIDLRQDSVKREMREWGEDFFWLLDSLDSLFLKTERRLHLLDLGPEDLADAVAEAESILSKAIKRSFEEG
jgi:hypothetical protein